MNTRKPGKRLTAQQVQKGRFLFNWLARPFKNPALLIIALVFYCLNAVMVVWESPQILRSGVPTRDDVIARIDFSYVDEEETQKRQTRAEAVVAPIFVLEPLGQELKNDLTVFLEAITQFDRLEDVTNPDWLEPWKINGQPINQEVFGHLSKALAYGREQQDSQKLIRDRFAAFVESLNSFYTIDAQTDKELETLEKVVRISTPETQQVREFSLADLYVFTEDSSHLRRAQSRLNELVVAALETIFDRNDQVSFEIISQMFYERLQPSLQLDRGALARDRRKARDQVSLVQRLISANEIILRKGNIPQAQHFLMIEAENAAFENRSAQEKAIHRLRRGFGQLVIFSLLCGIFMVLITEKTPSITRNKGRFFSFCLLSTAVVAMAHFLILKGYSPLWIPLPFVAESFQIVHGRRAAFMSTIFLGSILGLSVEITGVAITVCLGALTCIYFSKDIRSRLTLMGSGLAGGVLMAVADLSFSVQGGDLDFAQQLTFSLSEGSVALANGLGTGIFMTGLLPVVERLFNITTNITWLELGNMNRPLLRRMAVEAPGTWQHSQVLATLSEAAAQKIGANALMSRVVCYYHDIGKCIKPQYFIENLQGSESPHNRLTPTMSALVILSHPKDGEELAREHGLPHEVVDAILQHHGTTRVEFFYRMALKNAAENEEIHEEMFRYSGPRPQYKEMGIIMLADSAEGAVRALIQDNRELNPVRIRTQIEKIVKEKIEMNQLDESGLTLTEIQTVIEEFTRILLSFYHNRIKYPKSPEEEEKEEEEKIDDTKSTSPSS